MRRIVGKWLVALRVLCAIAILFVGFAHKPPEDLRTEISVLDLSAFALPDGEVPDICLSAGHQSDEDHPYSGNCEACRLGTGTLVPNPTDTVGLPMTGSRALSFVLRPVTVKRQVVCPNAAPRAPPGSLTV